MRSRIPVAPRADPSYIMQLATAIADLQQRQQATFTSITANYAANTDNEIILASAAGGAITVSLPDVKQFMGQTVLVKKMDATGNAVTVMPKAGMLIDGLASRSITTQYMSYTVYSTGMEWVIV